MSLPQLRHHNLATRRTERASADGKRSAGIALSVRGLRRRGSRTFALAAAVCGLLLAAPAQTAPPAPSYNVVWATPGRNYLDSMPIGNGDIGLNLWTNQHGDIVFLISKTDAWTENGELVKLGRVRVHLSPNPFLHNSDFRQILRPRTGEIDLTGADSTRVRIWVDANNPVIHLQIHSRHPLSLHAQVELWRLHPRRLIDARGNFELGFAMRELAGRPGSSIVIDPDTILPGRHNRITWLHDDTRSIYPSVLENQHLASLLPKFPDPLLHRIFGVTMKGAGLVSDGNLALNSSHPRTSYDLDLYALTEHPATIPQWQAAMNQTIARVDAIPVKQAWAAHLAWWRQFWNRSWINVSGDAGAGVVTQGFAMQRWMTATSGRGAQPIKFNGGIYTVGQEPPPGTPYNPRKGERSPDIRGWGSNYWFQNNRLLYWPMIADGDFDTLQPFFHMFLEDLPLAEARTRIYYHHGGAIFPETMFFFGLPNNNDFGWGNPKLDLASPWIRHHYNNAVEMTAMLLDTWEVTRDRTFARTMLVPLAVAATTWFAEQWHNVNGVYLFTDSQALETRRPATDPAPDIAGLKADLPRLLALPHDLTTPADRAMWKAQLAALPALPRGRTDSRGLQPLTDKTASPTGKPILWDAGQFTKPGNVENPALYSVFPFRLYGVDLPHLQLALNTFHARRFKASTCWVQDGIDAADLGLAQKAKEEVLANFTDFGNQRFRWFWKPGHDWIPDLDNGGVGQLILQHMLLQIRGNKLVLFPAWPKQWNVSFKLHAPQNTVVEGVYRNGKLLQLTVTPARRAADVIRMQPQ